jgi:hypothetical protein
VASQTDYLRGLTNRGIPELTLKDVSVVNQYIPHLRAGTPEGDALVVGDLPNGKEFTGPAWRWEQETLRLEYLAGWDRMLATVGDLEGGPGGTLGFGLAMAFGLDRARGAAVGALVDPFINNLDPRNPLNEQRVHNEPVNPFIYGEPTHLAAPSSEVEPSHVGTPAAGPAPESRKQGTRRRADTTKEPPPTSDAHVADQARGLRNRLGVAPPDVQPPPQTPSKVRSSPGLVQRQRRPSGPVSPSFSRGYRGSIEGPLQVLPSKRRVFSQERTTRPEPLPPAVVPAVKAPPNRTVRPNTTRSKVKVTDRSRNGPLLGAASTTGKAVSRKGLDDRGVPVAAVSKGEPLVTAKIQGKGKGNSSKSDVPPKETGAQQERRLLKEDRASGRPKNSPTYHAYEGKNRGSFSEWFGRLQKHVAANLTGSRDAPRFNDAALGENTQRFIDRHPNLKSAWERMNLKIDTQLKEIQSQKAAATVDQAAIRRLERIEAAVEKRRAELTDFENGDAGAKRPDLIEVFFHDRRALVTDLTQRSGDPLHNFKTQFYVELIKELLGWSEVYGVNFNNVYDQNITP